MTYEQTLSPVAITEENALQVALDAGLTLVEVEQSMAKGIALTEIAASAVRLRDQGLLRGLDECQVRLPLTLERIIQALSELKITVRLNLITREMEVLGLPSAFNPEGLAGSAHIILHDLLKRRYRCTKDLVADLLGLVAGQNRYNPVLDYFKSLTWDERDRMLELFSILGLHEEDTLSMVLVMKWSLQCVAMALNDPENAYGADGVLVLQGPQGIGKTTFARTMARKAHVLQGGAVHRLPGQGHHPPPDEHMDFRAWRGGDLPAHRPRAAQGLHHRGERRVPPPLRQERHGERPAHQPHCHVQLQEFLTDPHGLTAVLDGAGGEDRPQSPEGIRRGSVLGADVPDFHEEGESCFRLTAEEQQLLAQRNAVHEKPLRAQRRWRTS